MSDIGFVHRCIRATISLFGYFLGSPSSIQIITIGQQELRQDYEIDTCKLYIDAGNRMPDNLIDFSKDEDWFLTTDTSFLSQCPECDYFTYSFP